MAKQFDITGGPSREELFDALRLRHENRKPVFHVPYIRGGCFVVSVDAIGIEDGSGDNWLLQLHDPNGLLGANHLKAYFNTVTRRGWMKPLDLKPLD